MIFFSILLIPVIEIWLAIAVIDEFGFINAFFIWIISFILGLGLFRTSSLRLTVGVAKAMREGKPPGLAALDGALIGLAGVLFIVPGYFSDLIALCLLIPPLRRRIAKILIRKVGAKVGAQFGVAKSARPTSGAEPSDGVSYDASSEIIDVDAVVPDGEAGTETRPPARPEARFPRK